MKTGAQLIAKERERQIAQEGWTPEHDDTHDDGEIAFAAIAYIQVSNGYSKNAAEWPWDEEWFKVSDPVRNLVKAGALIAAEIDRLQRLAK